MSGPCKGCGHDIMDHDGAGGRRIVWSGLDGHEEQCTCPDYACPCGSEGCHGA